MKHTILIITFLAITALSAGCTWIDGKQNEVLSVQAMKDYTYAQKAEFIGEMKKELAKIQIELDRFAAKVDRTNGSAKADARIRLAEVREKWIMAKDQLDQAESSTESTWNDVKAGFKKVYGDLKSSFDTMRQWLSDKIEP